jgi:excinuclease UvrABC ATPase subunit
MIKFWLHLVKNNDKSSILADAFSLYNQTTNQNSESWVGCIKEIFKCLNLQFIYINSDVFKFFFT